MSGGFWNYQNRCLNEMADELRTAIAKARTGVEYYGHYSEEFVAEMSKLHDEIRTLNAKMHRVDWVLSGDDGEGNFSERLNEDLAEIVYDDPKNDVEWLKRCDNDDY